MLSKKLSELVRVQIMPTNLSSSSNELGFDTSRYMLAVGTHKRSRGARVTDSKAIENVAILGGGLMGQGIAEVSARSGFTTTLIKASGRNADATQARIEKSLNKAIERGKLLAEDAAGALARLSVTGELGALASADIVIESVIEDLANDAIWQLISAGRIGAEEAQMVVAAEM